ncbi:glycoside hydrolase family 3 protein [Robiginitomaculum antarcticum]|uniref:glycoside hydrolase family 3 protein n=1 Tax=Robiginitomaculum antarcticum TaxID=437507 RepID=UPI0004760E58|nr:glycoside hydrolase family 3 protein [Robiginitomaculum antarcticum]
MKTSYLMTGCAIAAILLAGCSNGAPDATVKVTAEAPGTAHPELWPEAKSPLAVEPALEKRIDGLMAKMTLRQKVGQIIQADIGSITPEDLKTYPLGSILNGGNSAPDGDNRSPASAWLALADEYYAATLEADLEGGPFIPMLWGTDAVHGHNNIPGATVFPHNIGLGATRNPALMRQIGDVTAKEIRTGGQEWTFAPTIAVVRDDRWGRTYEGYSENPEVTASYADQLILGIQGEPGADDFLSGENVIATAKHFIGDGGTKGGNDQGDNIDSEEELRDIHGAGYPIAVEAGAQVVMASFNSWQGKRMHGHKGLLTDVLKTRMGFDGFIVGDWNGHGQVDGCTNTDCPASLHAGLDMFMAPDSWRGLFDTTYAQAQSGIINMDRLDDAVRRILRVKLRSGLFEAGKPSSRALAGDFSLLQNPEHKAVARQAVRESLVLLKNNTLANGRRALPLSPGDTVLVAGDGADDIGKQSGGWTLNWQGTGNTKKDFPAGSSIYDGVKRHTDAAGGRTVLSVDGSYSRKPDVAIVVFGEDPYAEFFGDIEHLGYKPGDDSDLELIKKLRADGIPVVAVFLSGRPLWMNREINSSDAFVAAWLPGSEGGYAADVLFAGQDGRVAYDFKGTLPYSWPRTAIQTPLNVGDENYDPLFAYGYGLTYAASQDMETLPEEAGVDLSGSNTDNYMIAGGAVFPWMTQIEDSSGGATALNSRAVSLGGHVILRSEDDGAQENIRTAEFSGKDTGRFIIGGDAVDLSRQNTADMALYMRYRVNAIGSGTTTLGVNCGETACAVENMHDYLAGQPVGQWQEVSVKLSCFAEGPSMTTVNQPVRIESDATLSLSFSDIHLVANEGQAVCLD